MIRTNAEPGFYGVVTREAHDRYWRPPGERVYDQDLAHVGHRLIDSYGDVAEGNTPEWLDGVEMSPGEFMSGMLYDKAHDWGQGQELLTACGFETQEACGMDEESYWEAASEALIAHTPLYPGGIDAAHALWQRRVELAYDTEDAQTFLANARNWASGAVEGTTALIRSGRLPLEEKVFQRRLQQAVEIAWVPSYVHRLTEVVAGGDGGESVLSSSCSDRGWGRIFLEDAIEGEEWQRSLFVHEWAHFYLDGGIAQANVMDNGILVPDNNYTGLWEYEATTNPRADTDDSFSGEGISRHLELNEGLHDLLVAEVHLAVDGMGRAVTAGDYAAWMGLWRHMEGQGMDLTPFLGYKLNDEIWSGARGGDMYLWRVAMDNEFSRVFNPREQDEYNWAAFDAAVHETAQTAGRTYDDDPAPYIALLHRPGWLDRRRAEHELYFAPRADQPWGRHRLQFGGKLRTVQTHRGKVSYVRR